MKKYISRATKPLAIVSLFSLIMLLVAICLAIAKIPNGALSFGLIFLGGFLSVIFVSAYYIEKSRFITINLDAISLPRGVEYNGVTSFKRTTLRLDAIASIQTECRKGVFPLSEDTNFHTVILKDGGTVTFTLYAYGKNAEKKILSSIKENIGN